MKTLIAPLLVCLAIVVTHAQQDKNLVIEYNLFDDVVTYKKNNEIINNPSVKRGENIQVVITEFNPYVTKASIDVEQLGYMQSSQLANSDSKDSKKKSKTPSLIGGGLSLGEGLFSVFSAMPGSRGVDGASKEVMTAKSRFATLTSKMKTVEKKVSTYQKKIERFQTAEQSKELALADVNNLKRNANIRPSRIKKLMEEEVMYAFAKSTKEEIDIEDLISEMHKEKQVEQAVTGYESALVEYADLSDEWRHFSTGLEQLEYDESDAKMEFIVSASDSISKVMKSNLKEVEDIDVKDLIKILGKNDIEEMAALRQIYEELRSSKSFQYTFSPIQASGDEVMIKITFSQLDEKEDSYAPFKTLTQTVPVSGHWKVTGSVGVAFGKFKNSIQKYSVVDDVIVETPGDDFVPQVVSFVHMVKQTPRSLDFGLSLGVGLPLLSGGETQSAAFFLGPTFLVGHSQRILLSGGIMGSKAGRLSGGFNTGDTFEQSAEVLPIASKYELGYFLGVSFSVL